MCRNRSWLWVVCTWMCLLAGCGQTEQPARVIILGLDGLDPAAIDLMISEGQLPNFARLRSEGAYGKLEAKPPLLSPVLWTTIATGKEPSEHGIGHFVAADRVSGKKLPVTSTMRNVHAIWNIASDAGLQAATVGWWATWPPEPINGAVVSDHTCYHFLFAEGEGGGGGAAVTHPPELAEQISTLVRRPRYVSFEEASRFIDVPAEEFTADFDFANEVSHFRWALASAQTYASIGLELWSADRPDLLMVYIEGTDSISHLFGHLFRAQNLAGELAEQQRRYGRAVEEIYRYSDRLLGQYLEVMDERTTLVVLSDHGFKLGELHDDPSMTRDMRRVSERAHREHGILYLYGHRVRPLVRIEDATQLDIAPTVLALQDLEVARDMPGRVLGEALDIGVQERRLASYETGERSPGAAGSETVVSEQIMAHLESLGYLEEGASSPTGDRNMAALHFQAGRYSEAAAAYGRLIESEPDDSTLYTSLAGCLGAMGRYREALESLARGLELNPVNVEAYHNRAVIHERLGDNQAAIADYSTAVRYDPSYEPSRRALVRLAGSADVHGPGSAAEERAAVLADRASAAARRGAYEEAMSLLEQAEAEAPDYVLVHQYKSNVAFLMGDLELAAVALEKALTLEPDNARLQRNLEHVRTQLAASTQPPGE